MSLFTLLFLYLLSVPALAADDFARVPQEPLSETGSYINPNEADYRLYAPSNKKQKGALVAVGTFRGLVDAGQGSFSEVVLLDGDTLTTSFNKRQIQILAGSKSTANFLAKLSGTPELEALFAQALNGDAEARETALQKLEKITGKAPLPPIKLSPAEKLLRVSRRYVQSLFRDYAAKDAGFSFLTNPQQFHKIQALAQNGKIHAVNGDLSGKKTLQAVGKILQKKQIPLSVLDVSNAPDYVILSGDSEQYLKNIEALPFAKDGKIYFTVAKDYTGRVLRPDEEAWLYFTVDPKQYVREGKTYLLPSTIFNKDRNFPYYKWIGALRKTPANLNRNLASTCPQKFQELSHRANRADQLPTKP